MRKPSAENSGASSARTGSVRARQVRQARRRFMAGSLFFLWSHYRPIPLLLEFDNERGEAIPK
ncbi:hypothetical protein D3C75_1212350 [compost metagenome]